MSGGGKCATELLQPLPAVPLLRWICLGLQPRCCWCHEPPQRSAGPALVGATWLSQVWGPWRDLSKRAARPRSPHRARSLSPILGGSSPSLGTEPSSSRHRGYQFAEAAAFPEQGGDGRRGSPSTGGGFLAMPAPGGAAGSHVSGVRSVGVRGLSVQAALIKAPSAAQGWGEAGGVR